MTDLGPHSSNVVARAVCDHCGTDRPKTERPCWWCGGDARFRVPPDAIPHSAAELSRSADRANAAEPGQGEAGYDPGRTTRNRAATYRKRPVEVEAMQFTASGRGVIRRTNRDEIEAWIGRPLRVSPDRMGQIGIDTLEGTMWAAHGDWIIRGVQGEFYPCKPDIFEATYESA